MPNKGFAQLLCFEGVFCRWRKALHKNRVSGVPLRGREQLVRAIRTGPLRPVHFRGTQVGGRKSLCWEPFWREMRLACQRATGVSLGTHQPGWPGSPLSGGHFSAMPLHNDLLFTTLQIEGKCVSHFRITAATWSEGGFFSRVRAELVTSTSRALAFFPPFRPGS